MDLILPAKARKTVYITLAIIGLGAGAIPVGYQAVGASVPHWYLAGAAVFSFIVAAPFTLAVLNTNNGDPYLTATAIAATDPVVPADAGTDVNQAADEADPATESDPGQPEPAPASAV